MTITHLTHFRMLAHYNTWINTELYRIVGALSEQEQQQDCGAFFQSIHGTLNHILLADRIWLGRFKQGIPHSFMTLENLTLIDKIESLGQILYPDFEELSTQRQDTDHMIERWMQELDPDMLTLQITYRNTQGVARTHALWFGLTHFFNHQTHHRGQVTILLHQRGQDYGVTDLIALYAYVKSLAQMHPI